MLHLVLAVAQNVHVFTLDVVQHLGSRAVLEDDLSQQEARSTGESLLVTLCKERMQIVECDKTIVRLHLEIKIESRPMNFLTLKDSSRLQWHFSVVNSPHDIQQSMICTVPAEFAVTHCVFIGFLQCVLYLLEPFLGAAKGPKRNLRIRNFSMGISRLRVPS